MADSGRRGTSAGRPFAGDTALFYARYRRKYPAEFIAHLGMFSRGGSRLLDLGCGTGQLVLQLAGCFEHAVGIDPEPDMLREAERIARERGIGNVEWMTGRSAELHTLAPTLGLFGLVTIGTAFHFMEPRATLSELRRVAAGGAVAVAYSGSPMWLQPDPWAKALRSVLETRFGRLDDADFTAEALRSAEGTMRDLGYTEIECWQRTAVETIDVDFIVGHIPRRPRPTRSRPHKGRTSPTKSPRQLAQWRLRGTWSRPLRCERSSAAQPRIDPREQPPARVFANDARARFGRQPICSASPMRMPSGPRT